jgi:hypothetical protein
LTLRVNTFSFGAKPANASTDNMPNDELVDEIPF